MVDENLVAVTNNENPIINLEIIAYKNEVSVDFVESVDAAFSVHNVDENAHNNILTKLKSALESEIMLKANQLTTYTKTETDAKLSAKVDMSDTTVTKQGNIFNSANKLVQLNASAQLPVVSGANLTNLAAVQITDASTNFSNLSFSNINSIAKKLVANLGMPSASSYIDLTLGASGSTYTAPANGYLYIYKTGTAIGQYVSFNTGICLYEFCYNTGYGTTLLFPVKKNDVVTYTYSLAGATNIFRFHYAQGEI